MIVGTAGHIDHGKTTLVRALTGTDTDRLPEEKQRGISIELGYAFLQAGDRRIAFVDVPGHERLVATMLAGASGIDHALVLVAADDGVMPQTREHVAALALLGVASATLVVTKTDRADATRVASVTADASALLVGTTLAGGPTFEVAAAERRGVEALRAHLVALAAGHRRSADARAFRLAVDRAFSLAGLGTVATGTAHAGSIAAGGALRSVPAAGSDALLRVRSVHAQGTAVDGAAAGQRVALQLAGVEARDLRRGSWLVDPAVALETTRFDALLTVWRDEPKALRSGTPVHVHVGAEDVPATLHVLAVDGAPGERGPAAPSHLPPGAGGRVQLVLHRPIAAWRGDRVVLRDASATRTVAGGAVLDPHGPARHRASAERLAELDALARATAEERLAALVAASPHGVDLDRFRRAEGLRVLSAEPPQALVDAARTVAISIAAAEAVRARIAGTLDAFHSTHPDQLGPDPARLRRLAAPRLGDPAWRRVLAHAEAAGTVVRTHGLVHLPAHATELSVVERRIAEKALPRLVAGGFDPPWVRTLAADLREAEGTLRAALLRLAQRGELHQVVKDLFYPKATLARVESLVRAIVARDGAVTVAAFRDASGLGRKRAIQIVEHLDRVGLLRRVGDEHRMRGDATLFAEPIPPPR